MPTGRVAVAVVEDDLHFRLFLEAMFEASPRHRLVAVAGTAAEALTWSTDLQPHVVLVDVGLPDGSGTALLNNLLPRHPTALAVIISADDSPETILEAMRAGAVGYVLKGGKEAEFLGAVDDALAGGAPMSPMVARRLIEQLRETPGGGGASARPQGQLALLTERESTILELVAEGALDKEVADRLGLARSTVKNALFGVYGKWRVRSRTEAAVLFTKLKQGRDRT